MIKFKSYRLLIYFTCILTGIILVLLPDSLALLLNKSIIFNELFNNLLRTLGCNLSTAGFIAFLIELILKDEFFDKIKFELKKILKLKESSIIEYSSGKLISEDFKSNFEMAKSKIDILAISSLMSLETYEISLIKKIYEENCEIRILILDPEAGEIIKLRANDEPDVHSDDADSRIKNNINDALEKYNKLMSKAKKHVKNMDQKHLKGSLRVRTYCSIPYFGYTRFDDKSFVSPYFSKVYGVNSPVIIINREKSDLFDKYKRHFQFLWDYNAGKDRINISYFSFNKNK